MVKPDMQMMRDMRVRLEVALEKIEEEKRQRTLEHQQLVGHILGQSTGLAQAMNQPQQQPLQQAQVQHALVRKAAVQSAPVPKAKASQANITNLVPIQFQNDVKPETVSSQTALQQNLVSTCSGTVSYPGADDQTFVPNQTVAQQNVPQLTRIQKDKLKMRKKTRRGMKKSRKKMTQKDKIHEKKKRFVNFVPGQTKNTQNLVSVGNVRDSFINFVGGPKLVNERLVPNEQNLTQVEPTPVPIQNNQPDLEESLFPSQTVGEEKLVPYEMQDEHESSEEGEYHSGEEAGKKQQQQQTSDNPSSKKNSNRLARRRYKMRIKERNKEMAIVIPQTLKDRPMAVKPIGYMSAEDFQHATGTSKEESGTPAKEKVTLEMCSDYWRRGGCHFRAGAQCHKIHLCKFFITHICRNEYTCALSHDPYDKHNLPILERTGNKDITVYMLKKTYKAQTIQFKSKISLPEVCKFYNGINEGCKFGAVPGACSRLHMCRHYVLGNCRYTDRCRYSHDLFSPQPRECFMQFGVDVDNEDEELLLYRLQEVSAQREKSATNLTIDNEPPEQVENDDFVEGQLIKTEGDVPLPVTQLQARLKRRLPLPEAEAPIQQRRKHSTEIKREPRDYQPDQDPFPQQDQSALPLPPILPPGQFNPHFMSQADPDVMQPSFSLGAALSSLSHLENPMQITGEPDSVMEPFLGQILPRSNQRGDNGYGNGFDQEGRPMFNDTNAPITGPYMSPSRRDSRSRRYSPGRRYSPSKDSPHRRSSPSRQHSSGRRYSPGRRDSPRRDSHRRRYSSERNSSTKRYSPRRDSHGRRYSSERNSSTKRYSPRRDSHGKRYSPERNSSSRRYSPRKESPGGWYSPRRGSPGGRYSPQLIGPPVDNDDITKDLALGVDFDARPRSMSISPPPQEPPATALLNLNPNLIPAMPVKDIIDHLQHIRTMLQQHPMMKPGGENMKPDDDPPHFIRRDGSRTPPPTSDYRACSRDIDHRSISPSRRSHTTPYRGRSNSPYHNNRQPSSEQYGVHGNDATEVELDHRSGNLSYHSRPSRSPRRFSQSPRRSPSREFSPAPMRQFSAEREYPPVIERSPPREEFQNEMHEFSPTRRDFSPGRRDFSPGRRDFSPSRRDFSPSRRDFSPLRERFSPGGPDVSPGRGQFSHRRRESLRRSRFSPSPGRERSLHHRSRSPRSSHGRHRSRSHDRYRRSPSRRSKSFERRGGDRDYRHGSRSPNRRRSRSYERRGHHSRSPPRGDDGGLSYFLGDRSDRHGDGNRRSGSGRFDAAEHFLNSLDADWYQRKPPGDRH